MNIIQIFCILFLTFNLSYANENATVLDSEFSNVITFENPINSDVITFENPDPEAHLNAFLDKLKEGYKYKLYEHVPHGDLDFIPQPLLSGGYLFVALSLWLTVAFSCAMCGFIYCVKDHYKRRDPITVIV